MNKSRLCLLLMLHAFFIDFIIAAPALKKVIEDKVLFGTAINADQVAGVNPKETELILKHCNTITHLVHWKQIGHCLTHNKLIQLSSDALTVDLSSEKIGGFTGVYLGMYASGNGQPNSSTADFDWYEYNAN